MRGWRGAAWHRQHHAARHGKDRHGAAWRGMAIVVHLSMGSMVQHGTTGPARCHVAQLSRVQLSTGSTMQYGMARHGTAWHGMAVKLQHCTGKTVWHSQHDAAQRGVTNMVQDSMGSAMQYGTTGTAWPVQHRDSRGAAWCSRARHGAARHNQHAATPRARPFSCSPATRSPLCLGTATGARMSPEPQPQHQHRA